MTLVELTPVPTAQLPIAEFKDHLRLGTGFADDATQDSLLETFLRSALSAIEQRTSKALYLRPFHWKLISWRGFQREELPLAPVATIDAVKIIEPDGSEVIFAPEAYALQPDAHRPLLVARGYGLPTVPVAGSIQIEFMAGYAPDWQGLPTDLRQAVLLTAADYHEQRHDGQRDVAQSTRVTQLIAPYRVMRLFGGRS